MLTSHAESDRHMEHVIRKGYRLEELLDFSRGGMGEGTAFRNPRRFLNKRNLRRVGGIMRNANLTQSFSISRASPQPVLTCFQFLGTREGHWGMCLPPYMGRAGGGWERGQQDPRAVSHPTPLVPGDQRERTGSPEPCLCPSVGRQTADTAKILG